MSPSLLSATITGEIQKVRDVINDDEFVKNNEEILLSLRVAIQNKYTKIVALFDKKFNLDINNDPKTIALAAGSNVDIWNVFFNKPGFKTHKFETPTHPLVVSFRLGVLEIATVVKDWSDKVKVPVEVKVAAMQAAANNGHVECIRLFNVSDKYMIDVINRLIVNGHSDKVHVIVENNASTDFTFNKFEALKICSAHFDALSSLIIHPSVKAHVDKLPQYYKYVETYLSDPTKQAYFSEAQAKLNRRMAELVKDGSSPEDAFNTAIKETAQHIDQDKDKTTLHTNSWLDDAKKKEYVSKLSPFVESQVEKYMGEGLQYEDARTKALLDAARKMKDDEAEHPYLAKKWVIRGKDDKRKTFADSKGSEP